MSNLTLINSMDVVLMKYFLSQLFLRSSPNYNFENQVIVNKNKNEIEGKYKH